MRLRVRADQSKRATLCRFVVHHVMGCSHCANVAKFGNAIAVKINFEERLAVGNSTLRRVRVVFGPDGDIPRRTRQPLVVHFKGSVSDASLGNLIFGVAHCYQVGNRFFGAMRHQGCVFQCFGFARNQELFRRYVCNPEPVVAGFLANRN